MSGPDIVVLNFEGRKEELDERLMKRRESGKWEAGSSFQKAIASSLGKERLVVIVAGADMTFHFT